MPCHYSFQQWDVINISYHYVGIMCCTWYPKYMQLHAHQLFAFVKISRNLNYIHQSLLSSDVLYNLCYKIHLMHQCFIKNDPHITIYEWTIDARPGGSWTVVTHKGHIVKVMLLLQGFYVDFLYLFIKLPPFFGGSCIKDLFEVRYWFG